MKRKNKSVLGRKPVSLAYYYTRLRKNNINVVLTYVVKDFTSQRFSRHRFSTQVYSTDRTESLK